MLTGEYTTSALAYVSLCYNSKISFPVIIFFCFYVFIMLIEGISLILKTVMLFHQILPNLESF
jgi:hypothetical protein